MRIAHFSDLHLLSLEGARILDFANKRWIGGLNLLTNRGRHYHTHIFAGMICDLNQLRADPSTGADEAGPTGRIDHAICTGDVTNLALRNEFEFAREHFCRLALSPSEVTVVPGNHDAYVACGSDDFREIFADYCTSDDGFPGGFPMVRIRPPAAIIGLSTSRQTPWFTAYGVIGDDQLARLDALLRDPRLAGLVRIVAIHHPPAGREARNRIRGLRDWQQFAEVIAGAGAELILHGHEHRDIRAELPGPEGTVVPVLGVQSGTFYANNPRRTARYRVLDIMPRGVPETDGHAPDTGRRETWAIHSSMRVWDPQEARFVPDRGPRSLSPIVVPDRRHRRSMP